MPNAQLASNGTFDLILQAGLVGKLVLLLLLAASVFSWAIIFAKSRSLKAAAIEDTLFLEIFWHGKNVDDVFSKADQFSRSPVAQVFKSGYKELKKLTSENATMDGQALENIRRSLGRAAYSEVATLEKSVSWLATTASASPFVGLFGTVWGIMNSFQNIGATGAANLAIVAPGISEALITTAAGIGAAIPAVIAYNHFAGKIKREAVDMDCFTQDFLNIVSRSMASGKKV